MTTDRGDLLRGTLEMLILRSLEGGSMHGYGITERLQNISAELLTVDEGSLYPALYRMQKKGLVTSKIGKSEKNRKARFYTITKKGKAHLQKSSITWLKFSEAVSRAMAG